MVSVELIYDNDCPNVSIAREQLSRAFTDNISCCRLYADPSGGFKKVPSVQLIASTLRNNSLSPVSGNHSRRIGGWRSTLATLPGIGASLLPVGICPACWPAYAGLLSSLGLGFLMKTAYLLPLMILFLAFAVGALGFRAKTRRGYGPFALGILASGTAVAGKFVLASDLAMYGGIALLVGAPLWNGWPRKKQPEGGCPACDSGGIVSEGNGSSKTILKEVIP